MAKPMLMRWILLLSIWVVGSIPTQAQLVSGEGPPPTPKQLLKRRGVSLDTNSLVAALKNKDREIRYLAAQELANDGIRSAVPALIAAVQSEGDLRTRINIASALAQLGSTRGFDVLRHVCMDQALNVEERLLTIQYLLNLNDQSCNKIALEMLKPDSEAGIRVQAMHLLRRMTAISSAERLRALNLVHDSLFDQESSVKLTASDTLVWLSDKTAIPVFERAIADESNAEVASKLKTDLKRLVEKE